MKLPVSTSPADGDYLGDAATEAEAVAMLRAWCASVGLNDVAIVGARMGPTRWNTPVRGAASADRAWCPVIGDHRLTPDELREIGEALYGPGWKSPLADLLGFDYRRIKHWMDRTRSIPPGVAAELAAELRRRGKQALALADRLERK